MFKFLGFSAKVLAYFSICILIFVAIVYLKDSKLYTLGDLRKVARIFGIEIFANKNDKIVKFEKDNLARKKLSGKILIIYKPVFSVSQTYEYKTSLAAKQYNMYMVESAITPRLIETRINRVKVPVMTTYYLNTNSKLIVFKFDPIRNSQKVPMKFQFAIPECDGYEDFGHENMLILQAPLGLNEIYIRAVDYDNNTCTRYLKLNINVPVVLSKLPWFWGGLTFVVVYPVLYFLFNYLWAKRNHKIAEKLALDEQRNIITADLHDDLGATLSSLQLNCAVANQIVQKDPTAAQKILNKIEEQAQALAEKIGDVIWSLKPGKDEYMPMSLRIKNFVNDILGATNINYSIKIDYNIDTSLQDIATRKNLIMIVKEAINNAAKYSNARNLGLTMSKENNQIFIEIKDDGIGFEKDKAQGNGLNNMEYRVKSLGGKFEIKSAPNKGTSITATLPCH